MRAAKMISRRRDSCERRDERAREGLKMSENWRPGEGGHGGVAERVAQRSASRQLSGRPWSGRLIGPLLWALLLSLSSPALAFFIDRQHSPASHQWSYSSQPDWRQVNRECSGKAQSPVDIQRRNVIENGRLRLQFFNYDQPIKFRIQNAHHTVKLEPFVGVAGAAAGAGAGAGAGSASATGEQPADPDQEFVQHQQGAPSPDQAAYGGRPSIKLGWLDEGNNEFRLRDIHFHWGERRDNGSEHAIDGRKAAMEMHLVHVKHGLDNKAIGYTSDSVTVISVLIESYRKSNADFNPIVKALGRINMSSEWQEIEYRSLNDMLPYVLDQFYTYPGSLTTPPCYQVVNWVVMSERLYLNAKQVEVFRNIYAPSSEAGAPHQLEELRQPPQPVSTGDELLGGGAEDTMPPPPPPPPPNMMPNIRHLQPLNNRTIMASFAPLSKLEQNYFEPASTADSSGSRRGQFSSPGLHLAAMSLWWLVCTLFWRQLARGHD